WLQIPGRGIRLARIRAAQRVTVEFRLRPNRAICRRSLATPMKATARYPREAQETNADTSCVRQPEARNRQSQALRTLPPTTGYPRRKRRARAAGSSPLSPARGRRPRGPWAGPGAARARRARRAAHSSSRPGKPDWRQSALYIRAFGLEPGRELER